MTIQHDLGKEPNYIFFTFTGSYSPGRSDIWVVAAFWNSSEPTKEIVAYTYQRDTYYEKDTTLYKNITSTSFEYIITSGADATHLAANTYVWFVAAN